MRGAIFTPSLAVKDDGTIASDWRDSLLDCDEHTNETEATARLDARLTAIREAILREGDSELARLVAPFFGKVVERP